jgi:hypothetical protein
MPSLPFVDPGPLRLSSGTTPSSTALASSDSKGYDVIFTYKAGGPPGHHVFSTLKEAQDFAKEYSKGVYSTADGTLTSIKIVNLGNTGGDKTATAGSGKSTGGKLVMDEKTAKSAPAKPAPRGPRYTSPVTAAEKIWPRNATRAAQNLQNDTQLTTALQQAAAKSKYFSEADLRAIVSIESSANRQTGKNKYGYAGLFQLGPEAAKDVGYDYNKVSQPKNWKDNIAAGVAFLDKNAARLKKAGLEVTPLNAYIAHQQGATGGTTILEAVADGSAKTTAANKNQLANLPPSLVKGIQESGRKVTVQDYYDYWRSAFQTVSNQVNPANSNTPKP